MFLLIFLARVRILSDTGPQHRLHRFAQRAFTLRMATENPKESHELQGVTVVVTHGSYVL